MLTVAAVPLNLIFHKAFALPTAVFLTNKTLGIAVFEIAYRAFRELQLNPVFSFCVS